MYMHECNWISDLTLLMKTSLVTGSLFMTGGGGTERQRPRGAENWRIPWPWCGPLDLPTTLGHSCHSCHSCHSYVMF